MTNERAIEIFTDLSAWLNDCEALHWSAAEIASAIRFTQLAIKDELTVKILYNYRDWLEFGQPFYHSFQQLKDCLTIAIETLKSNQ